MSAYTFISSRDPVGGDHLAHELASQLARSGHEVTFFLVENGTFLAREGVCDELRGSLKSAGVELLADELALRERGILDSTSLSTDVASSQLGVIVDHMAAGRKVSWH